MTILLRYRILIQLQKTQL